MKVTIALKNILTILLLLHGFTNLVFSENRRVQYSVKSENALMVTINFDSYSQNIFKTSQDNRAGAVSLPVIRESLLFLSESEILDIQITSIQTQDIDQRVDLIEDIPIGVEPNKNDATINIRQSAFESKKIGKIGSQFVHRVQIFHAFKKEDKAVSIINKLQLCVSGQAVSRITSDILSSKEFIHAEKHAISKKIDQAQTVSVSKDRLKIMVPKDGIYVLPLPMIQEAGFDLQGVDPHYLRITNRKKEIPIRIVGEDDGSLDYTDVIEFWGEALWDQKKSEKRLDIYATQNVYWLEVGDQPGLRMGQIEGRIADDNVHDRVYANSFPYAQHVERDQYFHRLAYARDVDDTDYWFYSNPIVGGEKRDFGFHVIHPDLYSTQLAKIRFGLQGQVRDEKIHPFEIYINNRAIGENSWTGIQSIIMESESFSTSYLREGHNVITIINRSTEGELSQLILDWFELTYPRLFEPSNNLIQFQAPNYSFGKIVAFEIEDFTDTPVEIYKNGSIRIFNPEIISFTDTLDVTTYEIQFQDRISDEKTQYVALTLDQKMVPDSVAFVEAGDLRSSDKGADYIMITASDSLGEEALTDLIDLRESQGYHVETVLLNHIYYEFSDGIPNPEGIRNFLRYAKNNWNPSPRFVLLVGDGIINNRASQASGNHIPTPLHQTVQFGASSSDHWYTLLDDDEYPDMAIGRFPVRTLEELQLLISKIINYETTPRAPWMNQYLLIGAGGHSGVFKFQSEEIIEEVFNPRYQPQRLYLYGDISDPDVGGTEDLLRHFRDGMAMVNFRGHGGGAIWSDGGLLDMDDIELIENKNKLTIITSMTCFTADFSSSKKSIGEALLCQEEGGTAAFWGSTGLGWVWNDYYMLRALYQILNSNTVTTIGEMIMHTKRNYLMTYGGDLPLSEAHQYVLLGDPALSVHLPNNKIPFDISKHTLEMNETFSVQGETPSPQANIQVEVVDTKGYSFDEKTISSSTSDWQTSITLPENFPNNKGGIRTYAWDSSTGYHASGFESFQVGSAFFSEVRTNPINPTSRDSIRFSVKIEDQNPITSVWCRVIEPFSDSLSVRTIPDSNSYMTETAIGPIAPGIDLLYSFEVMNSQGTASTSDTTRYRIPYLPDFMPLLIKLGGTDQVQVEATIMNGGEEPAEGIPVLFEDSQTIIGSDTISISSYGSTIAKATYFPISGEMVFRVTANTDSTLPEKTISNNSFSRSIQITHFNVTPDLGTLSGQSQSDEVGLKGELSCNIPPHSIDKQTVMKIERYHVESAWFSGESVQNPEYTYHISLSNFSDDYNLHNEAQVTFYLKPEDRIDMPKPYRWEEKVQNWIVCNHTSNDSLLLVRTNRLGVFTLMDSDDNQPPQVQFQVNDQSLTNGSYVPRNPSMSLVVQDESGIDIREESIQIYLNDQIIDPSQIIIPDSVDNAKHISIGFRPQVSIGDHRIYGVVKDIHGNSVQSDVTWFQVSSEFDLQFLGNHPNPFNKETVFVYVLTDVADYLSLKIYTVSGRLIRTFDDYSLTSADYHEVVWDGSDDWGEKAANGVYFFRLKARNPRGSREITGKIAIIR